VLDLILGEDQESKRRVEFNTMRVSKWRDWFDFLFGFKDGVVRVTGVTSKLYICNANISSADSVFYWRIQDYFKDDASISLNFNNANR
jgi:hypothetical protein